MWPNDADHRPRASGSRFETTASSRDSWLPFRLAHSRSSTVSLRSVTQRDGHVRTEHDPNQSAQDNAKSGIAGDNSNRRAETPADDDPNVCALLYSGHIHFVVYVPCLAERPGAECLCVTPRTAIKCRHASSLPKDRREPPRERL